MKKTTLFLNASILIIILLSLLPSAIAQEESEGKGDYSLFGLELEKILSLINGIIALILSVIAFIAYRSDGRNRFLYVSIAFFIFSIKGFLLFSETIFPDIDWIDPSLIILEFFGLLAFFFGVIKKGG
ncbi:MAG: hypothetical protein AABX73_04365 [Nanoarchaeota archaeon]